MRNADRGFKFCRRVRKDQITNGEISTVKFGIINCCHKSEILNPKSNIEAEPYLDGTSQGATPQDTRKDGHILGRSRQFVKYPG